MVRERSVIGQLEFGLGFNFCPFVLRSTRRRRGGNVGPDVVGRDPSPVERGGPAWRDPRFPPGVISTALFISFCPRSAATRFIPRWGLHGMFWAKISNLLAKTLRQNAPRTTIAPSPGPGYPPFLLRPTSRCAPCASTRRASRCGERYAPAGPECCRPTSDPRSARASGPRGSGW